MAIDLSQEVIDKIHKDLEGSIPLSSVKLLELQPYYRYPDWDVCNIPVIGNYTDFITEFVISLLILAAEEELDGYPMEATNEIS